ncbi:hypothetical protein [Endozoicomonas lisbonensis]|uniref:Transcriptional regulator n=1 Tax=Endozoicomonas lisbonensis TaxID=3120522 RepID=A0ABV2SP41_9GAMM
MATNGEVLKVLMQKHQLDKYKISEICSVTPPAVDTWRSSKPTDMPDGLLDLLGYWLVYTHPDKPYGRSMNRYQKELEQIRASLS